MKILIPQRKSWLLGQEHVFCKHGDRLGKLKCRKIMAYTLPVVFDFREAEVSFIGVCMDTSDQIIYILVTQQGWAYCRQGAWTKREVFCDCFLWILHGRFWLDGRAESNKLYLVSLLRDIHDLSDVQTVGWIHVQKRLNPGQRQKGKREGLYQEEERAVGCL